MHVSNTLFILLVTFNLVYCESSCLDAPSLEISNLTAYASGIWHHVARYPNPYESVTKCISFEYNLLEGEIITIKTVNISERVPYYGEAYGRVLPDKKLFFNFTINNVSAEVTLSIVGADYDKYVVYYGCSNNDKTQNIQEFVWIIARTANLSNDDRAEIEQSVLSSKVIDQKRLIWIDHSGCK